MKINDLSYNATGARYGYNSQEQSTEIDANGNHTTAEFWEYDARSARRWNNDPRPVTGISPYATFQGNPIMYSDPFGDSIFTNKYGEITRNDKTDKMVFLQDGKSLQKIGDLGDKIDITGILPNVLERNSNEAKNLGFFGFGDKVMTGRDWDYKNEKESIFGLAWAYDKEQNAGIYDEDKKKYTGFNWNKHYTFKDAAAVGNYHAGYVGKFPYGGFGIPDNILLIAGGAAETWKNFDNAILKGDQREFGNFTASAITLYMSVQQINMELEIFPFPLDILSTLNIPLVGPAGDRPVDNYWNKQGMKDATNAKKKK